LKIGPMGWHEISVMNYHYLLSNNPWVGSSFLIRDKSFKLQYFWLLLMWKILWYYSVWIECVVNRIVTLKVKSIRHKYIYIYKMSSIIILRLWKDSINCVRRNCEDLVQICCKIWSDCYKLRIFKL
jgi:hypothetical protein